MSRTHELRFEGPNNAGLRAAIRDAVRDSDDPAAAVRSLAGVIALTASGRHTLGAGRGGLRWVVRQGGVVNRAPHDPYRTTYHRDGDVTLWSVYHTERRRIARMTGRKVAS